MEAPESVVTDLKSIRPTFRLICNVRGKVVGERSFDVNGNAREVTYEPRWELWDTDVHGVDYKVCTLEDEKGGYKPPGGWLVQFINLINPERYGGDPEKLIQALVDDPNQAASEIAEQTFGELAKYLTEIYFTVRKPRVVVPQLAH